MKVSLLTRLRVIHNVPLAQSFPLSGSSFELSTSEHNKLGVLENKTVQL